MGQRFCFAESAAPQRTTAAPCCRCPKLTVLNLSLNPVASQPGYREQVLQLVPQLQVLDDEDTAAADPAGRRTAAQTGSSESMDIQEEEEEDGLLESLRREMAEAREELELVRESIKYTATVVAPETEAAIEQEIGERKHLPPVHRRRDTFPGGMPPPSVFFRAVTV